jgi:hypothetical protein
MPYPGQQLGMQNLIDREETKSRRDTFLASKHIGDANTSRCHETLKTFQEVCKSWGVPLADDKTVEPVRD